MRTSQTETVAGLLRQREGLPRGALTLDTAAERRQRAGLRPQRAALPHRVAQSLESLGRLLGGGQAAFEGGSYVTLRLTSAMYHRFHAPADGRLQHVSYLSGDTWNVNPIALARVQRLFCRNERAVLRLRLDDGTPLALVPVAAVLVASIRLHALDVLLHLRWPGPNEMPCDAALCRGQELGWFEHGSTILVFTPAGFALASGIGPGTRVRMGQALLRRVKPGAPG